MTTGMAVRDSFRRPISSAKRVHGWTSLRVCLHRSAFVASTIIDPITVLFFFRGITWKPRSPSSQPTRRLARSFSSSSDHIDQSTSPMAVA